jgi:hypothetical protein
MIEITPLAKTLPQSLAYAAGDMDNELVSCAYLSRFSMNAPLRQAKRLGWLAASFGYDLQRWAT